MPFAPLLYRLVYSLADQIPADSRRIQLFFYGMNALNEIMRGAGQTNLDNDLLKYLVTHAVVACKHELPFFQYLLLNIDFNQPEKELLFKLIGLRLNNSKKYQTVLPITHLLESEEGL